MQHNSAEIVDVHGKGDSDLWLYLPDCWLLGVHQLSAQPVIEVAEQLCTQHFIHVHQSVGNVHSEMQKRRGYIVGDDLLFLATLSQQLKDTLPWNEVQTCSFGAFFFVGKDVNSSFRDPEERPLVLCLTYRYGTAPCHQKTRRHTPPLKGSGIYVVVRLPVGSKRACRPAGKLPASPPQMTRCHPEHARDWNVLCLNPLLDSYTKTHFNI